MKRIDHLTEPAVQAFLITDLALRNEMAYAIVLDDGSVLVLDRRMPKEYVGLRAADGSIRVVRVSETPEPEGVSACRKPA